MKEIRASIAEKFIGAGLTVLAGLLALFAVPSAQVDARVWSGGSGDWQTGVQGGWDGVWAAGDTGTFNGPGGTVTVKGDIATGNGALAFSTGGYTLQSDGATVRTITVSNSTVTLGDGVTTIGSNVTLARSGNNNPLTFDGNSTATSTLNINSGGNAVNGSVAFTVKEATANVNPGGAIESAEFTELLEAHLADRGFCSDMQPLLRAGVVYDPREAGEFVKTRLLSLLPGR